MAPVYDPDSDPIFGAEDQRLDFESSEVRLVVLQPGKWNDDIECELRVVGLNEKPKFIAISYYWGRSRKERDSRTVIRIRGHELEVPINLYTGLRRLRHETEEITLWADAISINQKNSTEMSDQVARMTQLYRQCEEVRVFLDDATKTNDIDAAPEIFLWSARDANQGQYDINPENATRLRNVKRGVLTYNQLPKALRHKSDEDPILGVFHLISMLAQNEHFTAHGSALRPTNRSRYNTLSKLHEIMTLPWWRRQWVVQETVFGKKVTLQYRGFICPWEMFGLAAANCREHMQDCCSGHYAGLPPTERESLESFTRGVTDLDYWRKIWEKEDRGPIKDAKINLLQLLRQFRSRETSVPKDKVYALLSMVNDWDREDPIRITYEYSDEAVFREVVNKMLSVCKDLSILMGNTGTLDDKNRDTAAGENGGGEQSMPSWVTDWTGQPDAKEEERLRRSPLYKAGGKTAPEWRILPGSEQERVLELVGFRWDVVAETSDVMPYEDENLVTDMFEKWEIFLGIQKGPAEQYRDGTDLREAYWRTICMDTVYEGNRAHGNGVSMLNREDYRMLGDGDQSYQGWMAMIDDLKSGSLERVLSAGQRTDSMQSADSSTLTPTATATRQENDPMDSYRIQMDEAIVSATASRRLFRTKGGLIGLGPSRMAAGDEIWVLLGGSMPFLLRPSGEHEMKRGLDGKAPCHRLVGECYAHGTMLGEALREWDERGEPVGRVYLV